MAPSGIFTASNSDSANQQSGTKKELEDVEATLQVITIIRELVGKGESVDCIDVWAHDDLLPRATNEVDVVLGTISDRAFRFFENHHFTCTSGA